MNQSAQLNATVESLLSAPWFTMVGQALCVNYRIKRATSWDEAFLVANHPGTAWCSTEAKNLLYSRLAVDHYDLFVTWNEYAREHLPLIERVMRTAVAPRLPMSSGKHGALSLIQATLVGALMEVRYSPIVEVDICRRQLDLFVAGFFPCGWALNTADEFPDEAELIVY